MPLEKIRILSLLVISATVAAFLCGDLEPIFCILFLAATGPLWYGLDLDKLRSHPLWKIYGSATFGLVVLLYYLNIPMKTAVFSLVLFCVIFELYGETRQRAPVRLLSLLSFLIVLYYARIESGLMLLLGVLIYIFSVIFVLLVFHQDRLHRYRAVPILRLALPTAGHFAVIFAAGLVFFWVLPRSPHQSLGAIPTLGGDRISGFTSRVTLNDIGSLKLSRKHILDLKPLSGDLHSPYLKGKVLDHYSDGIWSSLNYLNTFPKPDDSNSYRLGKASGQLYEYRIDLEALHGNTVFFMDNLVSLKGSLTPLKVQGSLEQLNVLRELPLALSYTFWAAPGPIPAPEPTSTLYLQLPSGLNYFKTIGDEVLAGAEDLEVRARVNRILRYFSTFKYTLDINNGRAGDPLKYFLKTTKAGHCELFASAMVLLLRAQGIPARLVTGFYIPFIHPSGDFYYVTESDAHAWVEYYDQGYWHCVDPTPATSFTSPTFLETRLAYIRRFWRQVLSWNYDAQLDAMLVINDKVQAVTARLFDLRLPLWQMLTALAVASLLVGLRRMLLQPQRRLAHFYRRFLARLERRFGRRGARETVQDYCNRLDLPDPIAAGLMTFIAGYQRSRFGREPAGAAVARELIREGRALLKMLEGLLGGAVGGPPKANTSAGGK